MTTTDKGKKARAIAKKTAAHQIIKAFATAKHIQLPKKNGDGKKHLYTSDTVVEIINLTWDVAISIAMDSARLDVRNIWNKDNSVVQQYSDGENSVVVDKSSLMELKSLFKNEQL